MKLVSLMLLWAVLQSAPVQAADMPRPAGSPQTLLQMVGARQEAARLSDSVLIVIDAQREYVDGKLPLAGIEPSLREAQSLLQRARKAGTPIIHVVHKGGGPLFNADGPYFAVVPQLLPAAGEPVIEKTLPNAFARTALAEALARSGRKNLIVIGYMTHMCVSSTVRAALDLGYRTTVVAAATATRDLPDGRGGVIPAAAVQAASLAALADRFASIAWRAQDIQD